MQQLEIHIANELDDEQWNNWNEVLKYIKDLEESSNYNWEQYQDIGKMYFDLKEKIEKTITRLESTYMQNERTELDKYNNQFIVDCVGILEELLEEK